MNNSKEDNAFLTKQIITYLGNKRNLLSFIGKAIRVVQKAENKEKLDTFDVFSGSGIVSRYLKQFSNNLITNDLENYSRTINRCYLTNKSDINEQEEDKWLEYLRNNLTDDRLVNDGFIQEMYSPKDNNNIQNGERVFYTSRNAKYIDSARKLIGKIPEPYQTLFLGNLLYEASTKTNTSGVFKGFYKNSQTKIGQFGGNGHNALQRIMANINIEKPILSNFECNVKVLQGDANVICREVPYVDLAYLDPPYNQHPYSSNYFMLNLINDYKKPLNVSKVSGIPTDWNKSAYNNKKLALDSLMDLCRNLKAKYILISFNNEGYIPYKEMVNNLKKLGDVRTFKHKYNVFRGCRNLKNRNKYTTEYLFLLNKESYK